MPSTSGCTPRPARQTAERSYLAAAAAPGKMWVCGYNRVRGAVRSGGDGTGGTGCGQQAGGGETGRRYDQDHQLLLPPTCGAGCHRIIRAGWSTTWLSTAWTLPTSTPVTPRLLCGQSQRPANQFHPRGFTHVRPSPPSPQPAGCRTGPGSSPLPAGLLFACRPRMEPEPRRLRPRASHPAVTRDARRGGDRPSPTGPSTTPSTSAEPRNGASPLSHAPSRRT